MTGASLQLSSSDHRPVSDAIRAAAEWSRRDGPTFFVDQCKEIAQELYQQTAAIAPSKAEIAADVRAQGWEIPTEFHDPDGHTRIGRGDPSMWANREATRQARRKQGGKRGRPKKGETRDERYTRITDKGPTLQMMERFVIAIRNRARFFLASGWLGALVDLGGSLKQSSGNIDHERGGADIIRGASSVTVSLWNRTPGMAEQEAKHQIVEKTVAVRLLDLAVYMNNAARAAYRGIFRG